MQVLIKDHDLRMKKSLGIKKSEKLHNKLKIPDMFSQYTYIEPMYVSE